MSEYILDQRRRVLEDSFFAKVDQELLRRLQEEMETQQEEEQLARVSGISDKFLLDRLIGCGIKSSTWAAMSLVPLVEVAWADGHVVDEERVAVLKSAHEAGLESNAPAYQLLEQWLHHRPEPSLRQAWKDYVHALCENAAPDTREAFRTQVLERAQRVAEAWGGMLGMGNAVSDSEQKVLDDLHSALGH